MGNFTADALILRAVPRGASDKLLTLLSSDGGRFYAILKGAGSTKRREAAATEPFTLSNFEFYEKNGMRWVKNATVQNAFEGLRYDAERLFLAAYLSDVAVELTEERTPPGEFYPLILNAFYLLSQKTAELDKIKGAFEMRAAALSGFCPDLSACAACGALPTENMRLDVMNGALLCPACYAKQTAMGELPVTDLGERRLLLPLTASAAAALHFTVTAEPKRLFSFRLTDERSKRFFGEAAEAYLLHHLERGFSTLQNYKHLQRMGDLCPPPQA